MAVTSWVQIWDVLHAVPLRVSTTFHSQYLKLTYEWRLLNKKTKTKSACNLICSMFLLWAGGSASCSIAVSLVSMRNANNANYPSWENWRTNVETVSHIVSMFDKENEPKKTKQPSNSDVTLSVLAEFLHIHCTFRGNRCTLLFLLTPDIFFLPLHTLQ